ncbi:hypothetical protein BDN72DRAFT_832320 [Pluteus cervinus]|uniref:Uncharacterized protein n=1 Tax=Pluteus cervinus TaxID=181527 RepID=A0ACD3BAT7_9AGAR|nr:hypothetical protein BDN72DRAFT_832320 [Pluteus cervinus]
MKDLRLFLLWVLTLCWAHFLPPLSYSWELYTFVSCEASLTPVPYPVSASLVS